MAKEESVTLTDKLDKDWKNVQNLVTQIEKVHVNSNFSFGKESRFGPNSRGCAAFK